MCLCLSVSAGCWPSCRRRRRRRRCAPQLTEDPAFAPVFESFKDQDTFFAAYASVHAKLSELGSKFEFEVTL